MYSSELTDGRHPQFSLSVTFHECNFDLLIFSWFCISSFCCPLPYSVKWVWCPIRCLSRPWAHHIGSWALRQMYAFLFIYLFTYSVELQAAGFVAMSVLLVFNETKPYYSWCVHLITITKDCSTGWLVWQTTDSGGGILPRFHNNIVCPATVQSGLEHTTSVINQYEVNWDWRAYCGS